MLMMIVVFAFVVGGARFTFDIKTVLVGGISLPTRKSSGSVATSFALISSVVPVARRCLLFAKFV